MKCGENPRILASELFISISVLNDNVHVTFGPETKAFIPIQKKQEKTEDTK